MILARLACCLHASLDNTYRHHPTAGVTTVFASDLCYCVARGRLLSKLANLMQANFMLLALLESPGHT